MSQKYCPNCGEQIPENSKFCFHCGHKLPNPDGSTDTSSEADTSAAATTTAAAGTRKKSVKKKKKKKDNHIGYFIFLALILGIMLWLIHKKSTLPEEKPMKSLPSERPKQYLDYSLLDSTLQQQNDTIYQDEISLLSPELPKIRVTTPVVAKTPADDSWADDDDDDETASEPAYSVPPAPKPVPQVMLKTEQSVRNMLLSNRFVDPVSTDVITFTDNGNVMLKNGEAMTTEMEVNQISGNKAVMYFYDDSNNSWDVSLDVSGSRKRLYMMDQEFSSDN